MSEPKSKIERLWRHRGLFCLALAIPLGHRCGYVRVPEDHEWTTLIDEDALARYEQYAKDGLTLNGETYFPSIYATPERREHLARMDVWERRISVHGGVTFHQHMTSEEWEQTVEGGDGIPDGLWIGFDCGHAWDNRDPEILNSFGPEHAKYFGPLLTNLPGGEIRTLDYVVSECENMADQITSAHVLDEVAAIVNGASDAIP